MARERGASGAASEHPTAAPPAPSAAFGRGAGRDRRPHTRGPRGPGGGGWGRPSRCAPTALGAAGGARSTPRPGPRELRELVAAVWAGRGARGAGRGGAVGGRRRGRTGSVGSEPPASARRAVAVMPRSRASRPALPAPGAAGLCRVGGRRGRGGPGAGGGAGRGGAAVRALEQTPPRGPARLSGQALPPGRATRQPAPAEEARREALQHRAAGQRRNERRGGAPHVTHHPRPIAALRSAAPALAAAPRRLPLADRGPMGTWGRGRCRAGRSGAGRG